MMKWWRGLWGRKSLQEIADDELYVTRRELHRAVLALEYWQSHTMMLSKRVTRLTRERKAT